MFFFSLSYDSGAAAALNQSLSGQNRVVIHLIVGLFSRKLSSVLQMKKSSESCREIDQVDVGVALSVPLRPS